MKGNKTEVMKLENGQTGLFISSYDCAGYLLPLLKMLLPQAYWTSSINWIESIIEEIEDNVIELEESCECNPRSMCLRCKDSYEKTRTTDDDMPF